LAAPDHRAAAVTTVISPLSRLRRAARLCRAAADDDLVWLGSAIEDVLDRRSRGDDQASLDRALGVSGAGRLRATRAWIAEIHRRHLAALSLTAAAGRLARLDLATSPTREYALDDPRRIIAAAKAEGIVFPRKRQLLSIIKDLRAQTDRANCALAIAQFDGRSSRGAGVTEEPRA
jgi:hypothetical protein